MVDRTQGLPSSELPTLESLQAQQASRWLEAMREPTAAQEEAFVAWLKESPRNVREILLMAAIDEAMFGIDRDRRIKVKSLLAQAQNNTIPFPGTLRHAERAVATSSRLRRIAAAALILIALGLGAGYLINVHTSGWKEYQTARGEQRAFELSDGSVIQLNTDSRLLVRATAANREVAVQEGEAFFRVAHDARRPFRVRTRDALIEDLGTQFNVYDRSDGTYIAVLQGRVNVTPTPRGRDTGALPATRTIEANQQALVGPDATITVRDGMGTATADAIAWRDRRLVFRQETLERIVGEFNRYGAEQIQLDGPALKSRIYSGVFDADDPESLSKALERDPGLLVEETPGRIVIRER